jgi:hypothetical protein
MHNLRPRKNNTQTEKSLDSESIIQQETSQKYGRVNILNNLLNSR